MNNELAIYGQFDQLQRAAIALFESGYFKDATSKAQAIVKVMAGAELGLPPFASMVGINIVQGKPTLGANLIATLVKNDPRYNYRIVTATDKECVIEWFEGREKQGESSFTMQEAIAGNINKNWDKEKNEWKEKPTWKAYPSDMLFARAISRGARRYAPGIFGGSPVYTPDELGADTDENGFIEVIATEPTQTHAPITTEPDKHADISHSGTPEPAQNVIQSGDNGNENVQVKMMLDTALTVKTHDGKPYHSLDTETLSNMANTMRDVLSGKKKNQKGYSRDDLLFRIDAIVAILAYRDGKPPYEGEEAA